MADMGWTNHFDSMERDNCPLGEAQVELLLAARQVWERRGDTFNGANAIHPYSPLAVALLRLHKAIEQIDEEVA